MGDSAGSADGLVRLTELVPFLRWRLGEPGSDELVGSELAADPEVLSRHVRGSSPAWGTDDPQVLASLWWQAYAYRVGGTTLACWALSGAAPDASLAGTAVGIARHRPSSVIYNSSSLAVTELRSLLDSLFGGHLDRVAASLRSGHRIGEQLLWGNAAAAVTSALTTLASAEGAPPIAERVQEVTAALPHDMPRLGVWVDDHYRRKTCCLWWKTPASKGGYCSDCSLR